MVTWVKKILKHVDCIPQHIVFDIFCSSVYQWEPISFSILHLFFTVGLLEPMHVRCFSSMLALHAFSYDPAGLRTAVPTPDRRDILGHLYLEASNDHDSKFGAWYGDLTETLHIICPQYSQFLVTANSSRTRLCHAHRETPAQYSQFLVTDSSSRTWLCHAHRETVAAPQRIEWEAAASEYANMQNFSWLNPSGRGFVFRIFCTVDFTVGI
jgi:hypothetical protein